MITPQGGGGASRGGLLGCWQQAEETHKSFDAEALPLSLQDYLCVQFPPGLSLCPSVSHQDVRVNGWKRKKHAQGLRTQ